MQPKAMSIEEKGRVIRNIISVLRFNATDQNKAFDEGDTFFALCFKEDAELKKIESLCYP